MTAIYARQSADRADSISIETQISLCRQRLSPDEDYEVFSDRGFSGSNTNRPDFQKMLTRCGEGVFQRIITYKLDRISRSLLDFVLLLERLEALEIELVSCTESFSSKSDMGVLIMKLLVMFAEMERKNIRMRVRDNYYARGEKGFYLGGYAPFGYRKVPAVIDGKATSGYDIIPQEAEILGDVFNSFSCKTESLGDICRRLNGDGVKTRKGGFWSPTTLSRLLRNPFYVCADWRIFRLFSEENAVITSPSEAFDGVHGCIAYGAKSCRTGVKFSSFTGEHITVGRHMGIIPSEIWLKARNRLLSDSFSPYESSVKSYLTGVAVCGGCKKKYSVTSSKGYVYLYCRNRKSGGCSTSLSSVRADFLEEICGEVIKYELKRLSEIKLSSGVSAEENSARLRLCEVENRIFELKEKLKSVSEISADVFDCAARELAEEKLGLEKRIAEIVAQKEKMCYTNLREALSHWEGFSNSEKRLIAKEILKNCEISDGRIRIILL